MLHIEIIAVGKLKERFWSEACAEYLKRLRAYAQVNVKEVPDVDPAKVGGDAAALAKEASSIMKVLPEDAYMILLDVDGTQYPSEAIASQIDILGMEGQSTLAFVLGSSCGVDPSVKKRANERWSFGPITLPHNLARVVLLEQVYRAFRIIRHEPYHK